MTGLEQLASLVEEEQISLINMVAVPRSVSTALGRALNESGTDSVFINEPLNRNNRSLEIAADHIITALLPSLEQVNGKLVAITKNMATYIGDDEFKQLDELAIGNIWSVRDPLVQIGSLATRMANDLAIENGASAITQSDLGFYLDQVTALLMDSEVSTDFSRTGWKSISRHFSVQTAPSVVIDGTDLSIEPIRVLKEASEVLGLNYSDRMAIGWGSNYVNINIGTSRFDAENNAWTSHAATSIGIETTDRKPLELETLPQTLREHILGVAIPAYEAMCD